MTKKWLAHGLGLLIFAACAGVESGGEFASGRRALMSGDSAVALTYFEPIAKRDPNYVAPFTSFRESIWTYLGRAQYQTGKFVEAKSSLEKALSPIAKRDPNYVAPFTSFRESIWTYLGRAQYQTGKFVEAKSSLEKALSQIP